MALLLATASVAGGGGFPRKVKNYCFLFSSLYLLLLLLMFCLEMPYTKLSRGMERGVVDQGKSSICPSGHFPSWPSLANHGAGQTTYPRPI